MQFTAQAPLFPVFLLGILATLPEHRAVSQKWFDEVLQTPVRSVSTFFFFFFSGVSKHARIASEQTWTDDMLPSRQSVPPLYAALNKIWGWIDIDFPPLTPPDVEAAQPIHLRHAWWERLVDKVQNQEQEFLCLT